MKMGLGNWLPSKQMIVDRAFGIAILLAVVGFGVAVAFLLTALGGE